MAKKRNSSKNRIRNAAIIIAALILAVFGFIGASDIGGNSDTVLETSITDPSALSVYFIDIGQGDTILLAKDGHYALVDAGESMEPSERESLDAIEESLNSLGVKKLDFLLVTHQDYDHIGSARQILKDYDVGVFYDNGVEHTSATYEKLMMYILDNDVNYKIVRAGDKIKSPWDDVKIEVLSPPQNLIMSGSKPDVNENSIILKVTYGKVSYLLTGDAESDAEKYMLSQYSDSKLDCDVLKAGHHGSRYSSTKSFLNAVSPDVVVISCGSGNSYGHPHTDCLERLVRYTPNVYRTDVDGNILVKTDGVKIAVATENDHDYSKIIISGEGDKVTA